MSFSIELFFPPITDDVTLVSYLSANFSILGEERLHLISNLTVLTPDIRYQQG